MPVSRPSGTRRPAAIKRLPWMRRVHLYSPKADRMVVLFSEEALGAWALAEVSIHPLRRPPAFGGRRPEEVRCRPALASR